MNVPCGRCTGSLIHFDFELDDIFDDVFVELTHHAHGTTCVIFGTFRSHLDQLEQLRALLFWMAGEFKFAGERRKL